MNQIENVIIIGELIDGEEIQTSQYSYLFQNNGTHEVTSLLF